MRLEDLVDDVGVIQRVNDVLKWTRARSGQLFRRKSAGSLKDELVRPRAVTRHKSQGSLVAHRSNRRDVLSRITTKARMP